ncbi:MAG: diguanylate cyclase [Acetobacteraceae bacterium]|nr:diguanylate cyclase [Acetobacteraceae bacterium]
MTAIRAPRAPARLASHTGLFALVAVVCVALLGMVAFRLWDARGVKLDEARRETANLARSLAQHAQDAIDAADTVLLGLRERAESDGTGAAELERLHRSMAVQGAALPLVQGFFLFGADGYSLATSASAGPTGINYADRAYFQRHRSLPDRGPRVSGPFRSKTNNEWMMVVSRRLDRPDGSFAGVVLATMSVGYFQRLYGTFDVKPLGAVTLASAEGAIMARRPHDDGVIGRSLAGSELFREHVPKGEAGSFEAVGGLDGVLRLGSFHRVPRFPLLVIVSRAKHEVLAGWRAQAWIEALAVLAVALGIGALGCRVAGQVRERQRAEERYRLLADHSSDAIVCTGPDGRFRYVSPSFSTMTGWSREETLGRDGLEFVHHEDRGRFVEVLDRLRVGAGGAACSYRHLHKDGSHIWVEDHRRMASPPGGGAPECVGNIRDVTERKSLEDRLTAANAELTALSAIDGLTGLANRRRFDTALAAEWGRAGRERRPLSLLLLDADCFKAFNDMYGHPAGDEVLKTIASCIRASLRRPADLAARYGGEEFAVLLPETGPQGAMLVAGRIRREVEARRVPHAGAARGFVSVSLGVASVVPRDWDPAASLVQRADAALYEAKRLGRNRAEACAAREAVPEVADA